MRARTALALGLLTVWVVVSPRSFADDFLRGDVNRDGLINLADLARLASALSNPPEFLSCRDAGDVNDDGMINAEDIGPSPGNSGDLRSWLLRLCPMFPCAISEPYPDRGPDLTPDPLDCVDGFDRAADTSVDPSFMMEWRRPPVLVQGEESVLRLQVTTASAISGFSIAYRFNTTAADFLGADLEETVFPQFLRPGFESSPFFLVQPSLFPLPDPDFDLLLLGVVFVDPITREPIPFPATSGPIVEAPILRVRIRSKNAAPLGPTTLLKEPEAGDYPPPLGRLGALRTGFVKSDSTSTTGESDEEMNIEMIAFDPGEFLRGDASPNQTIDLTDAVLTLRHLFRGAALRCEMAADSNDDGRIELTDAIFSLEWLFRGGRSIPPPNNSTGCQPATLYSTTGVVSCLQGTCEE